jgi:hypothetical protein
LILEGNMDLRLLLAAGVVVAVAGCGKPISDTSSKPAKPLAASPSAVVIGQRPAESDGSSETAQTAPVAPGINWVSKPVEQQAMPMPGQPNDHSNLSRTPSQKSETAGVLESLPEAKKANSGEPPR